ncbi:toll/interleukin-1 receptor domain-containing protein [uncultured Clostridium sp.]|uniref:toll/interleukin-1 receptor domain-containing protein n=1 Tax=uncultured Clostridium sp. TaxID=59620 RepID=UPI0026069D35|nr:toll/interleukin-1 receptor domain-containing protein [uncultured Clostridium sp.]
MKVFISHKQEDSVIAGMICKNLKELGVQAYLDLLDVEICSKGKQLTDHIKNRLNDCSDILVVMSNKTEESWWVPFEIGMAAQKDFPVVSYLVDNVELPDYLDYWPRLRKSTDLIKYVDAKKKIITENMASNKGIFSNNSKSETQQFYDKLRQML